MLHDSHRYPTIFLFIIIILFFIDKLKCILLISNKTFENITSLCNRETLHPKVAQPLIKINENVAFQIPELILDYSKKTRLQLSTCIICLTVEVFQTTFF